MKRERKMWKRWLASVLCMAMALPLYPQQAATMAEGQKAGAEGNPDVCEEADYDGVEPTWGEWTEKEGQAGDWITAAQLNCKNCGGKTSGHSQEMEVAVTPEETKPASCEAEGVRTYKASFEWDGKTYEHPEPKEAAIPAKGHTYGEPVWEWGLEGEEKAAKAVFMCKVCKKGHEKDGKVEAISHKEATCTAPGEMVYKAAVTIPEEERPQFEKASYEGTTTVEEPIKGHKYGCPVWQWDLAGEEKAAKAVFACKACPEKDTRVAEVEAISSKEATCTESGEIAYRAAVVIPEPERPQFANASYEDTRSIVEPAKGHTYGEPVWGEWRTDAGTGECQIDVIFTCTECGTPTETKTVTGREVSRKAPTCKEGGSVSYQAQVGTGVPGETVLSPILEKPIPQEGHSHAISSSTWKWDAEEGAYYVEVTTACAKCLEENVLSVPAKEEVKKATCTETGEITYTAQVQVGEVGYPMSMSIWLPAEGHAYGEPEWRLSEDHKTVTAAMACTKCAEGTDGHRIEGNTAPKAEIVPASCTQAGKAIYTASVALGGNTYTKQIELAIPAAGHKMKKTAAKAATCETAGNTAYSACEACKKYFSDEQGKKEIAKDSWVVKKKGHKIKSVVAVKATKAKAGSLKRKCNVCGKVEDTISIPKTELEINIGSSAKVVKDPKKCKVSLKNASLYKKYLTLDANKGTIKTKKDYSVKFKESIPLTVKIADKTYKVNVKVKIPAPKVTIKKTKISDSYFRYTFKYNIKGADRVSVRCNRKDVNSDVLDRYLSKPKSDGDSYVNIRHAENEKLTFTIVAYYGKNASKKLVIKK